MLAQVPHEIQSKIANQLTCALTNFDFVSGGCINSGGKLETSKGIFFLKWNSAIRYPGMFAAEAEGLKLLRSTSSIRVPEIILTATSENFQFLLLEFVFSAKPSILYWQQFGEQLSELHQNTANDFGLLFDNYIGSLPQRNKFHPTWPDFFIEERLKPQVELAKGNGNIDQQILEKFNHLYTKIPKLLASEKPSLLHGDLWSGNLIIDRNGDPCLIDPAVFYGNREAEIAFTRLFGGFDRAFYDSYNANFPLEKDFDSRVDLYNLYPLMVHVNLFGGGYLNQVVSILKNYV